MDPVILATITSAVTVLATEAAKGFSGEAGKAAWKSLKSVFGWSEEPKPETLAEEVAQKLQQRPELGQEILRILQQPQVGSAQQLVGNLSAEKVIVAVEIHGGVNM